MIIYDNNTGLAVYPKFDSGDYMGAFIVEHNALKYIPFDDIKFTKLQLAIAGAVISILEPKDKE